MEGAPDADADADPSTVAAGACGPSAAAAAPSSSSSSAEATRGVDAPRGPPARFAAPARPRRRRSSLLPSFLSGRSRRRLRVAACGCLSSSLVCAMRLVLNPGPSAYVIHSIVVFFDMILIHLFADVPWLSAGGEVVTIFFASCFHFTEEKVFELLETTLIAVLVSLHIIGSRSEHWDREEALERDVVGLKLYIERRASDRGEEGEGGGGSDGGDGSLRRRGSARSCSGRRGSKVAEEDGAFVDEENFLALGSDETIVSSFNTTAGSATADGPPAERGWWGHFYDHFLDGSAGVLYTSFAGLIVDEIVNFGVSSGKR
ncbi:hypothetical protein ACHAWF_015501 [Thalassiosira exigua]